MMIDIIRKLNWRTPKMHDMPDKRIFSDSRPVIGLDFDGVLHKYTGWTGSIPKGPPVEGALSSVLWLVENGFRLFIFSTRAYNNPEGEEGIKQWLKLHSFPSIEVADGKWHADLYVDDRGFRFEGPESWKVLLNLLSVSPKPGRWGGEEI